MTSKDVYADDLAMADGGSRAESRSFVFQIEADADPDALFRIASQLNLANCAPSSASLIRRDDETLFVEVLIDTNPRMADAIARKLLQLTCVRDAQCRVVPAQTDGNEFA